MLTDDHTQTIERALASIAPHGDENRRQRKLLLGELKRVEESEGEFHSLVAQAMRAP